MDWKTRIPVILLWVLAVFSSIGHGNGEQRVVCYYTNWSIYRPGTAKFSPQNINPYLCTHLIYAFGGFTKDNTLKPFDKYQDIEKGGYAKFTGLKTYNKDLKTMLAIGGWNEGSSHFSPMVADAGRRKEFVKNSVKFLRQNHFDGLDLDWEYPAFRDGGKPRDRNNYADLVQELREEFEKESSKTGRSRLLLSMAVPAGIEYIEKGYDVPRLNEYLDFINLLSYDYHSAYEPAANHHAPLYPLEEDNEYNYDSELTIDYTINHLLKSGASPEKIVLGIPTYGRSYTLFNEDATDIGAPADGPGEEGDATREKGYLAYYEICESIAKSDEWQVVQPNPSAMGPYAYRGNQWVGYDDEGIVRAKARYVNEKKLGGIMFWSIDNDDFRGKCHGRPYPLIEAAKEALLVGDENSNSVAKTRQSEDRKKTRAQGGQRLQTNTIGRKFKTGRRSTTTEATLTRRKISSSRNHGRSNGRVSSRDNENVDENDENSEEEPNSLKPVEKSNSRVRPKNTRSKNQLGGGNRRKQQNSRRPAENKDEDESREELPGKKITTPEPPTTPDPGTDFKCEDEGFFSHPRDCKKYFWCLDSGPSGLGIVGHQFTCPSGLVFNKAADSCDYPRNVVCPKTKTVQSSVTTTRAPITAATSRTTYLHKPSQRTTTPKTDSEEEYEYYDVDDEDEENEHDVEDSREFEEETRSTTTAKPYKTISRSRPTTTTPSPSTTSTASSSTKFHRTTTEKITSSYEDEEDPRVLKELIDLIKKAGGIEQLEKQLLYQEKNSGNNAGTKEENGKSTPATISRSLYERVLNRQATRIAGGFLGSFSSTQSSKSDTADKSTAKNSRTGFVNGPGGAQFEGLDDVPEVKNLRRTTKPQYVTIERNRQPASKSPNEEEDDEEDEEDNRDVASSEDRAVSNPPENKSSNRRFTPSYVNIRRPRPSTTTSENDVELKDEGEESPDDSEDDNDASEEEEEAPADLGHRITKGEEKTSSPKSRYTNTQRFRSTTLRNTVDKEADQVKNESTTSATTSTTTTTTTSERPVPSVKDEISVISTAPSTTLESQSSSVESLSKSKSDNTTIAEKTSSKETSSTLSTEDTTRASKEVTLALVENSATEILFTTVPASSISTGSNYDSFTRGPSSPVSQPRPFGFSRRGRPTTTSTTASPTIPVTEQTRSKVISETVKLPTLKELVGLTTTFSNFELTPETRTVSNVNIDVVESRFDVSVEPTTTQPLRKSVLNDTTIAVNALPNDTNDPEYRKIQAENQDDAKVANNFGSSDSPLLESSIDRDILDNDILSSEEIQRRSSSASFVNVDGNQYNGSINDAANTSKSDNGLRRVEVPVQILDDTNGEEIAELVLLRVPENRLNSAILQPVIRVKILEQENERGDNAVDRRKVIKLENLPESSLENELAVEESSNDSSTNRPRNRQRVLKTRRRTRPTSATDGSDRMSNVTNDETSVQDIPRTSRRRVSTKKSVLETTTSASDFVDNFSTTFPKATTLRGNYSILQKSSNARRGFYITRNIDETSPVPETFGTDFVKSTQHSYTEKNDEVDDTTEKIQHTTLEMDSLQMTDATMPEIQGITQTDEIATTLEGMIETPREEIATRGSTTLVESTTPPSEAEAFASDELEVMTPDYASTVEDPFNESAVSWIVTTDGNVINEVAITTLESWTTEQTITTNPTIFVESGTFEYSVEGNTDFRDAITSTKAVKTPETLTEFSTTPKNNYNESLRSVEAESPSGRSGTLPARSDKNIGSLRLRFADEVTTESLKMPSDQDNFETTTELQRSETRRTPSSTLSTFGLKREETSSQTETSLRGTTDVDGTSTTHREVSNRGGIRYTTSAKPAFTEEPSRIRGFSRTTNKSFKTEHPRNNLVDKKVSQTPRSISTRYSETTTSIISGETTRTSRTNARKTTKAFEIAKTEKTPVKNAESVTIATTEDSIIVTEIPVPQAPYSTTDLPLEDRQNRLRTTISFNEQRPGPNTPGQQDQTSRITSTTGSYEGIAKSTSSDEDANLTTNFEDETINRFEASLSSTKDWTRKTEFFDIRERGITAAYVNGFHATTPVTTESYETSRSEGASSSEAFEQSDSPNSVSSSERSLDDHEPKTKLSSQMPLSLMTETSESNEKMLEQTTPSINDLTNSIEFTGNSELNTRNDDYTSETTGSFQTNSQSSDFRAAEGITTTVSVSTENYDDTMKYETIPVQTDYPTTNSIQESDEVSHGTMISDKADTFLTTVRNNNKIAETIISVNTIATNEIAGSSENVTESSNMEKITAPYNGSSVPWVYQRNTMLDYHKTEHSITSKYTTADINPTIASSTSIYDPNIDLGVVFTDGIHTKLNQQTVPEVSNEFTKTTSFENNKDYIPTESSTVSTTVKLPNTISDSTIDTTIGTSSSVEAHPKDEPISIERRSTTASHGASTYSTTDSSTIGLTDVTERPSKRTRGRVRFTNLSGTSDDSNGQSRRPIKQVVVRRRLVNKDLNKNATIPKQNIIKSDTTISDKNQKSNSMKIKDQFAADKNSDGKRPKHEDKKTDSRKKENERLGNKSDDRSSEEKHNYPKPTRRRVIVYRGRPRPEKISTTPEAETTTTVQSPNSTRDEIAEDKRRRRRKWRKRIVLKRSRINVEEDDQSIAETGDVSRVLIDDEHVKDFRDDKFTSPRFEAPYEIEKSSEREDFVGEVSLFKNSGAFLRRPGSLVRNDALNRSRPKVSNPSALTTPSSSKVSSISGGQSVDPTFEIKTDDQSVRAQELAVTLSDPPAFDTSTTGRVGLRKQAGTTRKISTTIAPRTEATTTPRTAPIVRRRPNKPNINDNSRNVATPARPRRPAIIDYDYYVDDEIRLVLKPELKDKLFVTKKGGIRCLDQGNFAHPTSCKKFITCARMVNGQVIGTEYTCPDKLSFDPVGGICNWSAGLGCEEKSKAST